MDRADMMFAFAPKRLYGGICIICLACKAILDIDEMIDPALVCETSALRLKLTKEANSGFSITTKLSSLGGSGTGTGTNKIRHRLSQPSDGSLQTKILLGIHVSPISPPPTEANGRAKPSP